MKSKRQYYLRRFLLELGFLLREMFSRASPNNDRLSWEKYEAVVKLKNEFGIEDKEER